MNKKVIDEVIINGKKRDLVSYIDVNNNYHQEVNDIDFNGHRVLWGFSFEPSTYLKESHLSGDQWRKGGSMTITRNGVSVFKEFCRTPERAFVVMQYILPKLQSFHWDMLEIGRKIYNHDIPAVITDICDDGEIMVESESGEDFSWAHNQEEKKEDPNFECEWGPKDRVHILSEHLYWWRK